MFHASPGCHQGVYNSPEATNNRRHSKNLTLTRIASYAVPKLPPPSLRICECTKCVSAQADLCQGYQLGNCQAQQCAHTSRAAHLSRSTKSRARSLAPAALAAGPSTKKSITPCSGLGRVPSR